MKDKIIGASMIHKKYEQAVSAYSRSIPENGLRAEFLREADVFMRSCAAGVWSKGKGVSTPHVNAMNAIYSRGSPVPSYLYWELTSEVMKYPGFAPPRFFEKLLDYDLGHAEGLSRRFIDFISIFMLLFAAVDDEVTEEEAAFVTECCGILSDLCDMKGLAGAKPDLSAFVSKPAGLKKLPEEVPGEVIEETVSVVPPLEELLAELDSLVGLNKVKKDVKSLINLVKVRKLREENGLPVPPMSLHLVFLGNPGTGKTTVARLLAKIYHAVGVLPTDRFVETDRSGLVAGYVGQTALKTSEVIKKAMGGVLFIDEAYSLAGKNGDFGGEAIEVLLKAMEDNRKDLIVIVAGYTGHMERFINSNPGLSSRFNKYFHFEDYSGEQLLEIFMSVCKKNGYCPDKAAEEYAKELLNGLSESRGDNFGNAREVRNLFEKAVARQSDRLSAVENPSREELMAIVTGDLQEELA